MSRPTYQDFIKSDDSLPLSNPRETSFDIWQKNEYERRERIKRMVYDSFWRAKNFFDRRDKQNVSQ